jgi:hypothetical protein
MDIVKYLGELMPQVTRSKMRDDISETIGMFEDEVLPVLTTADELFGQRPFLNADNKRFDEVFKREAAKRLDGNCYHYLNKGMKNVMDNLSGIARLVEKSDDKITKEVITITNLNLLQLIEASDFVARYLLRFLNVSLAREISEVDKKDRGGEIKAPLVQWLNQNRDVFIRAFNILSIESNGFNRKLNDIPDVVVNESTIAQQVASLGDERVDPLQLGIIPVRLNPWYRIGMVWGEWQAKRVLATRAEHQTVALRLIRLRQSADQNDVQINRDIDVMQSRLERLEYQLAEMEEDFA